ncbi:MAG: hypothetical protein ACOCUI_02750 [bacterium]
MHNGNSMIKATFNNDNFNIELSIDKFKSLWDDTYADLGNYSIEKYNDILGIEKTKIDLNSFVAEQLFSILDKDGKEDTNANNEYFENYDAQSSHIIKCDNGYISITGRMINF